MLTLACFNVFFGDVYQRERYAEILRLCLAADAHVIALQEVTRSFLEVLQENEEQLRERGFRLLPGKARFAAAQGCWYGVVLLSRVRVLKAWTTDFPTGMGRVLLSTELEGGVVFSTAHLESMASAPTRRKQLAVAEETGSPYVDHVVCGDFNMGEIEGKSAIPLAYEDCWTADTAPTFDCVRNRTIKLANPNESWQARCDRVIRKKNGRVSLHAIQLLGDEPFAVSDGTLVHPSDHYGLLATFSVPPETLTEGEAEVNGCFIA